MSWQPLKSCETIVKATILESLADNKIPHIKCHKTKKSHLVKGKRLERYLDQSAFDEEKEYQVCANLMNTLKEYEAKRGDYESEDNNLVIIVQSDEVENPPTRNKRRKNNETLLDFIINSS